jgi:hypothetical protein
MRWTHPGGAERIGVDRGRRTAVVENLKTRKRAKGMTKPLDKDKHTYLHHDTPASSPGGIRRHHSTVLIYATSGTRYSQALTSSNKSQDICQKPDALPLLLSR